MIQKCDKLVQKSAVKFSPRPLLGDPEENEDGLIMDYVLDFYIQTHRTHLDKKHKLPVEKTIVIDY